MESACTSPIDMGGDSSGMTDKLFQHQHASRNRKSVGTNTDAPVPPPPPTPLPMGIPVVICVAEMGALRLPIVEAIG